VGYSVHRVNNYRDVSFSVQPKNTRCAAIKNDKSLMKIIGLLFNHIFDFLKVAKQLRVIFNRKGVCTIFKKNLSNLKQVSEKKYN
jgi:hypothetical protein